ncbi:MAG: hypothetical protein IPO41_09965 [Acidobacteria bacterium]|nr:hypothetical protein [Acidobacteriota bacterium]MBP7476060.1 hypothetical protein [Pyrinomonadaceae bacterium]MBP9110515.1 hypothetical protein [Pyrinomonadaceae bacterium]
MKVETLTGVLFILCCYSLAISAQDSGITIPTKVAPFIEKGKIALALETADLNGDGFADYLLVVETPKADKDEPGDGIRTLLILTADRNDDLKLAARNDKVVYCRTCGGVFGDPFAGVTARRNSFSVDNYGGSNWRWSDSYKFNYSRIDKTWQLVLVAKDSFMATDPEKTAKTKIITPKKFGKINIARFDPDKIR